MCRSEAEKLNRRLEGRVLKNYWPFFMSLAPMHLAREVLLPSPPTPYSPDLK